MVLHTKSLETLILAIDLGQSIDVVFLDFKKAFDSAPHHRVVMKLEGYGISEKCLDWISSFLSNQKQRILVKYVVESKMAIP